MKFGGIVQWVRNQPGEGKLATPEASLATAKVTTPAMRRHANMGAAACSLEMTSNRSPRARLPGRQQQRHRKGVGARGRATAGYLAAAPMKRTVQAPGRPSLSVSNPGSRGPGDMPPRIVVHASTYDDGQEQCSQHGKAESEGGPELRPTELEGVGGPHKSEEAGKRVAPEPVEQRRARVERELQEEP